MFTSLAEIREEAQRRPTRTIAVAGAHDTEVLRAVAGACVLSLARFVLVGNAPIIRRQAEEIGLSLEHIPILHAEDETHCAEAAVRLVAEGTADIVLKGFVDSAVLLRAVLDKKSGLRTPRTVSHTVVMDIPGTNRLYLLTDAAMIIEPDLATKAAIIANALTVAQALGMDNPIVGVLCESEKVHPKMRCTQDAASLVAMNAAGEISGCRVGGPYALDVAVDPRSAAKKLPSDPLAGRADILLAPNLAAGNILYKSLMYFSRAASAGVVLGAKAPVLLNSRGDSHETKINSMALGILLSTGNTPCAS
ncbi:phosphate butyryltransferase [Thermodesulfomicrobium sp. WS]|uniref:phosphate acyltransferase n=1 Tax=Thermodesulfomicrobium sp. WS TaxID=3004129 RepID=UPI0024917739|nr:phosphate acyltransferase [Thermodesulfomicrobium sp. WS]BDV00774.1 phosphate butyryltransferase [Thermodesulfomicrobium sp. WS]